jgi:guanylate kinase
MFQKSKGTLIVISGPSGVGKTTISDRLINDLPNLSRSISATTRSPRKGEKDGVDYFFMNELEFDNRLKSGGFLEYAIVFGNKYGTPKAWMEEQRRNGNDILLEIDVQGAAQIKNQEPEAALVFILPPSREILEKRLKGRNTDDQESIDRRFKTALAELDCKDQFDYWVVNEDLEQAIGEVTSIIRAESCKKEIYLKPESV